MQWGYIDLYVEDFMRIGGGGMMTEWGDMQNTSKSIQTIQFIAGISDYNAKIDKTQIRLITGCSRGVIGNLRASMISPHKGRELLNLFMDQMAHSKPTK